MLKRIIRNISYITLALCIMFANFYVPKAQAKTLNDLRRELEQLKEDYKNNQLEKEMSEKEKQKIQSTINEIQGKIAQANEDIIAKNEEIERLNEEIAKDESEIEAILAFTQVQNGESAYLEYAFGAKDFTDFIYRLAVSEQLTTYNNELIETNKRNIEENRKKTMELEETKKNLASEQAKLRVEMDKIVASIDRNSSNMLSMDDQIESLEQQITMYVNMKCDSNEDIKECESRNNSLPADTAMWRPLEAGYVTGWYGNRFHPIWQEWRLHSGMDISQYGANAGKTKVYSVANGRVVAVFTSYSTCGGKKIYIEHNINGTIYTTGYWHLNNVFVGVGDIVTKDTVIATIAGRPDPTYGNSDGCSNGAHLHLELSTGSWNADPWHNAYYSNRFAAHSVINFPKDLYSSWSNRTKKY